MSQKIKTVAQILGKTAIIAIMAMFAAGATKAEKKVVSDIALEMVFVRGNGTINDFNIGKFEVTQGQWQAVMGNNSSFFKNGDNYPVESVSWSDISAFLRRLNALTGKNYRLPTDAEWHYAARGGNKSKGYEYSGSNNIDDVAWYEGNSGNRTHPVGVRKPNELGIHDMSGNVWEWCLTENSIRICCGGSWLGAAAHCRVEDWYYDSPGNRGSNTFGFRVVLP